MLFALASCSTPTPAVKSTQAPVSAPPGAATTSSKNPVAKYLELAGFRVTESGKGKLGIKFITVNHSEADLGDLKLHIRLVTSAAKPDDPPVTEFDVSIPALGPNEVRDVSATATTTLRLYELPDWQFLRADFDITSPTQ